MLVRVRDIRESSRGPIAVVIDPETNRERLLAIGADEARSIRAEFARERPRIFAAAAVGFPVPEAIPFELSDDGSDDSTATGQ
jgi:hypothetical protein